MNSMINEQAEKRNSMSIKSFIYLDEEKVYSLSSQVFQGLTEFVTQERGMTIEDKDQQSGSPSSGRLMANIINEQKKYTEKKFLHDYAYVLFEKHLIDSNKVLVLDSNTFSDNISSIHDFSFVKVTGNIVFHDGQQLSELTENYNEFGEALAYMQLHENLDKQDKEIQNAIKNAKGRNAKSQAETQKRVFKGKYKEMLIGMGLNLKDEFIDRVKYLLDFGYEGMFEIQMPFVIDNVAHLVSGVLDRKHLKIDASRLIRAYSRQSEKDFTIFGILAQSWPNVVKENRLKDFRYTMEINGDTDDSKMKLAMMNLVDLFGNIDNAFTGKFDNEYVLYPIAIYREL